MQQNLLETIGLLAWNTKETKEEFLHYARNGQVVEFAVLLVVARKKLLDSTSAVVELVGDLTQRMNSNPMVSGDKHRMMLDLLDGFHRAGDEIEAYVKKDKLRSASESSSSPCSLSLSLKFIMCYSHSC